MNDYDIKYNKSFGKNKVALKIDGFDTRLYNLLIIRPLIIH